MTLDEDLDAALTNKNDDPEWADVEVVLNGKHRVLRFTQMDGLAWADFAAQCPPNMKSPTDTGFGYNMRAMTLLAAPASGVLRDNGEDVPLTDEQWTKFFRAASGRDHRAIGNALFSLNEWLPSQAVVEAKKASAAESAKNSLSHVLSESHTPAS